MTPWGVVVPVKHLAVAKSRLAAYGDAARRDLALAFAADVVTAALGCADVVQVLVVTDDPLAGQVLAALGALVVRDTPDDGLNPALVHGEELLRAASAERGVATVSSDLPALQPADLTAALRSVPQGARAFVPDAQARGTTLLAAAAGSRLLPAYGPESRRAHLVSGALELAGRPGLRQDVDTPQDLEDALALGVGPHTRAAAARLR